MGHPSTLFRFRIDLSDIDRGLYDQLDLRVAMHPSETPSYLLSRVLAYALSFEEGLEFTPGGLSDPDEPCLRSLSSRGGIGIWIEIGNPSARKLHKASKAAERVKVFTYKDPQLLLKEIRANDVHRAEALEIFSFSSGLLKSLEDSLEKDNRWNLVRNEESLMITTAASSFEGELLKHTV
jgi:uncharacterized protein YaeQ